MTELTETTAAPEEIQALPAPDALLSTIEAVLDDHKAEDIVIIDLQGKSSIADYMIIATGQSSRQVAALSDAVCRSLKEAGLIGLKPEGARQGDWILIDAGDVIVHLFRPEVREFYAIEKMWDAALTEESRDGDASV